MASDTEIADACLPQPAPMAAEPAHTEPREARTLWLQVGIRWDEVQRQVTLATLEHFDGHHQRTCDALGISVKTLYNWMREWEPVSSRLTRRARLGGRGTAARP